MLRLQTKHWDNNILYTPMNWIVIEGSWVRNTVLDNQVQENIYLYYLAKKVSI